MVQHLTQQTLLEFNMMIQRKACRIGMWKGLADGWAMTT